MTTDDLRIQDKKNIVPLYARQPSYRLGPVDRFYDIYLAAERIKTIANIVHEEDLELNGIRKKLVQNSYSPSFELSFLGHNDEDIKILLNIAEDGTFIPLVKPVGDKNFAYTKWLDTYPDYCNDFLQDGDYPKFLCEFHSHNRSFEPDMDFDDKE